MANGNFIVHNGLQVGGLTIDAATGNITTSGTITTTGSGSIVSANGFGGLNPDKIYNGTSEVKVGATEIYANISGTNAITVTSSGVTIAGSLTVNGTTTTINSTTLSVDDLNIVLADGAGSAAAANGAGLTISGANATLLYTSATDSFNFNKQVIGQITTSNLVATGGTVTNITGAATTFTSTNFSTGNAQITGGSLTGIGTLTPSGNASVNLGSTSNWWATFYGVATQAKYADLAENYQADNQYEPGTVLEFGGDQEVTLAVDGTRRIAGVVSTNPAHLMNGGLSGKNVVALALTGRVPCKVIGPVKKGDLMVSAGFGYAKTNNDPAIGQVIGKALADFSGAKGVIEVVVGRF